MKLLAAALFFCLVACLHWALWRASDHRKITHGFDFEGRLCDVHIETNGRFVHWCQKDGVTDWALPICVEKCPKKGESSMCPDRSKTKVAVELVDGEQVCTRDHKFQRVINSANTYPAYRHCVPEDMGQWLLTNIQLEHDEVMSTLSAALVLLKGPAFLTAVFTLTMFLTKWFISMLASAPDRVVAVCSLIVAALSFVAVGYAWMVWGLKMRMHVDTCAYNGHVLLCACLAALMCCYVAVTSIRKSEEWTKSLKADGQGMKDMCDMENGGLCFTVAVSLSFVLPQIVLALFVILVVPGLLSTCEVQAENTLLSDGSPLRGLNRNFLCSTTSLLVSPLVVTFMVYFYFWLSRLTDAVGAFTLARFFLDKPWEGGSWSSWPGLVIGVLKYLPKCCVGRKGVLTCLPALCVGALMHTCVVMNIVLLYMLQKMGVAIPEWNFDSTIYAIIASEPQTFEQAFQKYHKTGSRQTFDRLNFISLMVGAVVAATTALLEVALLFLYTKGPLLLDGFWQLTSTEFQAEAARLTEITRGFLENHGVSIPEITRGFLENYWVDQVGKLLGLYEARDAPVPVVVVTVIVLSGFLGFMHCRIAADSAVIKGYLHNMCCSG